MPRVSVVVPTHDRADLVLGAVRSVLGQTFRDLEVVVVDDGSTDGTGERLEAISDSRLRYVRQDRAGPSAARNNGVRHAGGGLVTFLDSDDLAFPRWVETLASLAEGTETAIARCGVLRLDDRGIIRDVIFPHSPEDFEGWIHAFLPGTYALARELFEEIGGFTDTLTFGEHTELAMRLSEARHRVGWKAVSSPALLVRKRWSGGMARYAGARTEMAEYVVRHHDGLLEQQPAMRAEYRQFVGVRAARSGDYDKARRYLWQAVRVRPWHLGNVARLGAATVPAVGRRLWERRLTPAAPPGTPTGARRRAEPASPDGGFERSPVQTRSRPTGGPEMVSVIIPAYNAAGTLGEQLEALAAQTNPRPWEVIVVDDASVDDTVSAALRWRDRLPLRVVRSRRNGGVSHARNVGAAAARGDFLAICDADDRVAPGWLEALAEAGRANDLVGGALETESLNPPAVREGRGLPPRMGQPGGTQFPPRLQHGCNLGVWREVVVWLGGWHEGYRGGHDDVEFTWRAHLAGYRLGFAPDAVVHYRLRTDPAGFARQMSTYTRTYVRLFKEYRPAGLRHRPWGEVIKSWGWVLVHLPDLILDESHRLAWIRVAARNAGLLWGSLTNRVLYP
jgi:glycosyltransferase involved in cell wall biosynthesis